MSANYEVIPKEVRDKYGVPALGWLVLRASRLRIVEARSRVLDGEALGFIHRQIARLMVKKPNAVASAASRVHNQLLAFSAEHAVRIAYEADLLDVPLSLRLPKNIDPQSLLEDRQYKFLDLASRGYTVSRIAQTLGLSESGANRIPRGLYDRLGVESMPQAVIVGYEANMLQRLTSAQLQPYKRFFPGQPL